MSGAKQLDDFLRFSFSPFEWEEDAVFRVADLVSTLATEDWDILQSVWSSRPQLWQTRFADVLSEADKERAIPILLDMIQTGNDVLAGVAADSLRSFTAVGSVLKVPSRVIRRLESISQQTTGLRARMIKELLQSLRPPS